jgi:hypothetical protein
MDVMNAENSGTQSAKESIQTKGDQNSTYFLLFWHLLGGVKNHFDNARHPYRSVVSHIAGHHMVRVTPRMDSAVVLVHLLLG